MRRTPRRRLPACTHPRPARSHDSRKRFENAVDIAWKLYAGTGNSRYAERAFHLTEQARGMLLYQTLARTQLEGDLLDSASRQQEYDLSIKISYWEQEVALEQSKGKDADSLKVAQLTQLRDAASLPRARAALADDDDVARPRRVSRRRHGSR